MSSSLKPASFVVIDDTDPALIYILPLIGRYTRVTSWTKWAIGGLHIDKLCMAYQETGPSHSHLAVRNNIISDIRKFNVYFSNEKKGRFIHAYASFNKTKIDPMPEWKCLIDGNTIANTDLPDSPNNNWEICNSAGTYISPGVHDFTLQVTGIGNGTMFWLDWIAYRPPDGYVVNEGTMYFPPDAVNIAYSGNWQQWSPYNQIGAAEEGATAVLSFKGVSVCWYGFLWGVPTPSIGRGLYRLDGGSPVYFTYESKKNHTTYRHLFFQTPDVHLGSHLLQVTFLGSSPDLLPLSFTQLHVDVRSDVNTSIPPVINLHHLAAVYGGVLGGLSAIFIFGALGCIIAWRLRQESRWKRSPASEPPVEAENTEAPKSTPLRNNSKELGNNSGRPSCEDEHHQEIQMSPGPSHLNAVS